MADSVSETRMGAWLFPGLVSPGNERASIHQVVDAVVLADDAGIYEMWLGDEGPAGYDPFVVAAIALAQTSRIRIGIGVANPVSRHPGALAAMMCALDASAPGRVILGLGVGGGLPLDPFGLRPATVARLDESLAVLRAVFAGMPGDGYTPPAAAVCSPNLPIYLGGRGPRVNNLASTSADGVLLSGIDPDQLQTVVGYAHASRPIALTILPVHAETSDSEADLEALCTMLSDLHHRFPTAVVGASLVGFDPVHDVERFVAAINGLAGIAGLAGSSGQ